MIETKGSHILNYLRTKIFVKVKKDTNIKIKHFKYKVRILNLN